MARNVDVHDRQWVFGEIASRAISKGKEERALEAIAQIPEDNCRMHLLRDLYSATHDCLRLLRRAEAITWPRFRDDALSVFTPRMAEVHTGLMREIIDSARTIDDIFTRNRVLEQIAAHAEKNRRPIFAAEARGLIDREAATAAREARAREAREGAHSAWRFD
jgi:hypothetical protein